MLLLNTEQFDDSTSHFFLTQLRFLFISPLIQLYTGYVQYKSKHALPTRDPKVFYYYCYRLQLSVIVFAVQASFLQQSEYLLRKMSWTIEQFWPVLCVNRLLHFAPNFALVEEAPGNWVFISCPWPTIWDKENKNRFPLTRDFQNVWDQK